VLRQIETADLYEVGSPTMPRVRCTLSELVEKELPAAWRARTSVRDACNRWQSGAYIPQTVPCALFILMRHADDLEEAIVRAVNDTWDNDTIAAVVGAAVGALYGEAALPENWRRGLSGRTQTADEGRITALLDEAGRLFWQT
jgi:ADP-ribosylglycohydrolase